MNKGMLTVGIIILALISLLLFNVLNNFNTGGELDYYLLKETAVSAINDAIDLTYKRTDGLVRMDKEKFIESFLRRFADGVDATRSYDIMFYDINEIPPKVSIKINSDTVLTFDNQAAQISTQISSIVESTNKDDPVLESALKDKNNDIGKAMGTKSTDIEKYSN